MSDDTDDFDLILRNALIVDGTGAPARPGELAILDDRIAAMGDAVDGTTIEEIDVLGQVVAPGFIDVHTHDDRAVIDATMGSKIGQGVTTVIVGNCGISLAPIVLDHDPPPPLALLGTRHAFRYSRFRDYVEAVEFSPPSVNVAALIGHSTLRVGVMKDVDRPASKAEIAEMCALLKDALNSGAIGLSTGLHHPIGEAAGLDEVVALAAQLSGTGGVYATHMRNENDGVSQSLEETFETARRANVPVVISHHKCAGPDNWGRSIETLAAIEAARSSQTVGLSAYPYAASAGALNPDLIDPRIRIQVSWSAPHPEMSGRDLADIANDWGCSPEGAAHRLHPAGAIYFEMDEADVRRILSYPQTMIGSAGEIYLEMAMVDDWSRRIITPDIASKPRRFYPHPRLSGTFPRVVGHYSRDEGLFGLEEAVRRMTSLPARTFGLSGRGELAEGNFADMTIFDPKTISDRATFENPRSSPEGIAMVFVNGNLSHHISGNIIGRSGRLLRRSQAGVRESGCPT